MHRQAFPQYYVDRTLPVTRAAIATGLLLVIAITVFDVLLMPAAFSEQVVPLRLMTMVVPLLGALGATFLLSQRRWLPYLLLMVAMLIGFSALYSSVVVTQSDPSRVFGNTLFITFIIYLVLGLNFWQSVTAGWSIFVVYLAFGLGYGMTTQEMTYGALLLGASNLIGSYASFCLERNARDIYETNAELKRLARTDSLTGLYNRRTFDEHLAKVWKQARRDEKKVAVAVADIDHFKLYNDCYGNRMGDDCIRSVAGALEQSVGRPLDLVARYDGAAFAVVLYDPTAGFLESLTRSLCHKVLDLDIEHKASEATPTVSLSVGAAIANASGTMTPDQLLRQTDDALYEAKTRGRNQAIVYRAEWGQQTTSHLAAVLL